MKKKNLLIIILILVISFFKIEVEAASCTTEEKKALKQEAQAIEIIANLDSEESPIHEHYYTISFNNWSNKFYIEDSKGTIYQMTPGHTSEKKYGNYAPGSVITFKVYGAYKQTCAYTLMATIRVTFPHYNDYYLSPLCEGIEEYALCQRTYSGKIESEAWFEEQIKKYKASLEKQEEPEKETNIIDEITKYLSENPYIIVIAIVVILLIIVIVIRSIKTNKNKIKVNLDLK
ncbi:MAG: hypothetical protein E7162_03955 [Firmicutes bacterium]|nr:hypothetical protein [Bacillota bacterium]